MAYPVNTIVLAPKPCAQSGLRSRRPGRCRAASARNPAGRGWARRTTIPGTIRAVVHRPGGRHRVPGGGVPAAARERSECDSDEDPTALEEEDSVPGLFGAFRRRALTPAEREEKAARFVQRSFRNRQRRRAGPGEDDENDAIGSWKGTSAQEPSSSAGPLPSFPERNERKLSEELPRPPRRRACSPRGEASARARR